MSVPKFASAYKNKIKSPFKCSGPSMTEQHHERECNMNHILRKYRKTGLVDHFNRYQGNYSDVTGAVDFQTALNIVNDGNDAFQSLPANIRNQFQNNPSTFLDFVSDPENTEAMIEMGLAKPIPQEPVPAPPVADPVEPPAGE